MISYIIDKVLYIVFGIIYIVVIVWKGINLN